MQKVYKVSTKKKRGKIFELNSHKKRRFTNIIFNSSIYLKPLLSHWTSNQAIEVEKKEKYP